MSSKSAMYGFVGASNHTDEVREVDDYYATDPHSVEMLLKNEKFCGDVWECACGGGHISEVLKAHGYNVFSTELVDRGYGDPGIDFLNVNEKWMGDIITNPPFKLGLEFCKHAIDLIEDGHKVAMLLRINFLEGKKRGKFFKEYPPKTVYIHSKRVNCAKNGNLEDFNNGLIAYAWFIWEKPFPEQTVLKWLNNEL